MADTAAWSVHDVIEVTKLLSEKQIILGRRLFTIQGVHMKALHTIYM